MTCKSLLSGFKLNPLIIAMFIIYCSTIIVAIHQNLHVMYITDKFV